jgi:hypothetical protein
VRPGGHVVRLFTSMMDLSIVFRRAKGSGFVHGSQHGFIGVIGIHGIGCLSLTEDFRAQQGTQSLCLTALYRTSQDSL